MLLALYVCELVGAKQWNRISTIPASNERKRDISRTIETKPSMKITDRDGEEERTKKRITRQQLFDAYHFITLWEMYTIASSRLFLLGFGVRGVVA